MAFLEIQGSMADAIDRLEFIGKTFDPNNFKPIVDEIGNEFLFLVDQGFIDGRSPYGIPWQKSKKLEGKTLIKNSTLRRSFNFTSTNNSLVIGTLTPYASPLHFGAQPYTITAKKGKALKFLGADGSTIYRRSVRHPGLQRRLMVPIAEFGLPATWRIAAIGIINNAAL